MSSIITKFMDSVFQSDLISNHSIESMIADSERCQIVLIDAAGEAVELFSYTRPPNEAVIEVSRAGQTRRRVVSTPECLNDDLRLLLDS